jgi:hypothetical protein
MRSARTKGKLMGQQTGSSKSTSPPNPNYGSSAGTDNSNGVYNAGVASAAVAPTYDAGLGAGTIGATGATAPLASPALTPPAGATGTTDPGTAVAATGATGATTTNPNGAAYGTGAQPVKGQAKGQQPPTMQGAATTLGGALAGGPTGQPPAYSTSYVPPPPPATTAAPGASSPMSGTSLTVGDALGQGKSAKGGAPGAPAGTGGQSGGQTGVAGAAGATGTTGAPVDPNTITDPIARYQAFQAQNKAMVANAPSWVTSSLTGPPPGTEVGSGTNTNWQQVVKKMTGQSDPFAAMQEMAKVARAKGGNDSTGARRAMMAAGMDPATSARVTELFFNTGGNQEQAARRLGVYEQWAKMTQGDKWQDAVGKEKELEAWRRANPELGNAQAYPTAGATGTPGVTGTTGATGTPEVTGATGAPTTVTTAGTGGVVTPAESAATPGLTTDRVNQIARQYMVSPEIAKQIYMQILQQSQGSGGGTSENAGSSGDGGDGV